MVDNMSRWIRARVTVTDKEGRQFVFADVGPSELRSLKSKYKKVEIADENDWGRYLIPRNETDEEEKKEMKRILRGK